MAADDYIFSQGTFFFLNIETSVSWACQWIYCSHPHPQKEAIIPFILSHNDSNDINFTKSWVEEWL